MEPKIYSNHSIKCSTANFKKVYATSTDSVRIIIHSQNHYLQVEEYQIRLFRGHFRRSIKILTSDYVSFVSSLKGNLALLFPLQRDTATFP